MVDPSPRGQDLESPLTRIASLVAELERMPESQAREHARALVHAVLDIHHAGLARIFELLALRPDGPAFVEQLGADETVMLLMSLHDLHPRDVESRVRAAVDAVRPALLEQGVAIELDGVGEDTARVRLSAAGLVRATNAKLRALVEFAIYAGAPEIVVVEIDGLDGAPLVPAARLAEPRK